MCLWFQRYKIVAVSIAVFSKVPISENQLFLHLLKYSKILNKRHIKKIIFVQQGNVLVKKIRAIAMIGCFQKI